MSVNSKMTAIANATRALDGSTGKLTLDGIASKLGVEKTNVEAALAALVEKEVDVPAGSTSAALAELIASIEAGGTEFPAIFKVKKCITGSFTPVSNSYSFQITGFEGITPRITIVYTKDSAIPSSGRSVRMIIGINNMDNPYKDYAGNWAMNANEFAGTLCSFVTQSSFSGNAKFLLPEDTVTYKENMVLYNATDGNKFRALSKSSQDSANIDLCSPGFSTSSTSQLYFFAGLTYEYVIFY